MVGPYCKQVDILRSSSVVYLHGCVGERSEQDEMLGENEKCEYAPLYTRGKGISWSRQVWKGKFGTYPT